MSIKIYLYIITTMISAYSLTGINFDKFWRSKKNIEARVFIIILSLIMSYLLTNFIVDFLTNSKIIWKELIYILLHLY